MTKMKAAVLGSMFAAMTLAAVALPPAAAAARRVDWTAHYATTAMGSYVMGNPQAKVKLIEYLSLSCSHCAAFSAEGMPALKRDYIASGRVSLEVRNAVRDGFDLSGVMLARCGGPAAYFATAEQVLATQPQWMPKAEAYFATAGAQDSGADSTAKAAEFMRAAGFDQLMQARGMTPAQINGCLADKRQQAAVMAMTKDAWQERKIHGTPSFVINGALQDDISTWSLLQPKLDAALR